MNARRSLPFLVLYASSYARAVTIPSGTQLQARLTDEVSSQKSSGQSISAVVTVPVIVNGQLVMSSGAKLSGKTSDAVTGKNATDSDAEQIAKLRIAFTSIQPRDGKSQSISCKLTEVDNARESVDEAGLVTGITPSQTYTALMNKGIGKLADRYPGLSEILGGAKKDFVKDADPAIDYHAGVDLVITLTKDLDWKAPLGADPVTPIAPATDLANLVAAQPNRTRALKPPAPSDLTNLMFIGTKEQVEAAFKSAGWFPADPLGQAANMETARAIIEDRGYNEAPVSILTLDGRPPDYVFQKQTNTFAKRHHIRIWARPQQFAGKPVWEAAATHDIKFTFSQESRTITHGIDPDIDRERSKVTNDLLFSGMIQSIALVDRTDIPADVSNATGDKLQTDGKIAVLEFK